MKRNIIKLLPLALSISLLAGCGQSKETTTEESTITTNQTVIESSSEETTQSSESKEESTSNEEVKNIETTTITLYDGSEFEISNEHTYNVKEMSSNVISEPFTFTKYEYQIYPNTPLKYIKDVYCNPNTDGSYEVTGANKIKFDTVDITTGETTVTDKYSETTFITNVSGTDNYPNSLSGIDKDFLSGIIDTIGQPTYAVATYPKVGISEVYYIWMNVDDSMLIYVSTCHTEDNSVFHLDTYVTTVRGLNEELREALSLEIKEPVLEDAVMRLHVDPITQFVEVIDVRETSFVVKESYMSNENFEILANDFFSDLPSTGATFKEYAPNNTSQSTFDPKEEAGTIPHDRNYDKLFFSNKTTEKCTDDNLTVDYATKKLSNPGTGTAELTIPQMLERYGQPNEVREDYFYYITENYQIVFTKEQSDKAFTNRDDYFLGITSINVYYTNSIHFTEAAVNRQEYYRNLNSK